MQHSVLAQVCVVRHHCCTHSSTCTCQSLCARSAQPRTFPWCFARRLWSSRRHIHASKPSCKSSWKLPYGVGLTEHRVTSAGARMCTAVVTYNTDLIQHSIIIRRTYVKWNSTQRQRSVTTNITYARPNIGFVRNWTQLRTNSTQTKYKIGMRLLGYHHHHQQQQQQHVTCTLK